MSAPTMQWQMVDTIGSTSVPAARTYASLVSYNDRLYLFGGYGESKGRFNDVHEYNSGSHSWRLLPPGGDVPKPVYLHSAVQHRNSMIVFGGNSGKESSDLYYFDLDNLRWSKSPAMGIVPTARYGHSSCVYGGGAGHLLIVGGCKSNNTFFKDTWSLDLSRFQWRRLEDLPLDLAYHSLITWEGRAYLYGGYNGRTFVQHMYVLDSMTGKWSILQASGQVPPPMCGAATVLRGHELFVFGGYTEKGHTNELYRFNMRTRVWSLLPTLNKPLARAYLQAAIIGESLLVYGGYNGSNCISDFRSVQLPAPVQQSVNIPANSHFFPAPNQQQQPPSHQPACSDEFMSLPPNTAAESVLHLYAGGKDHLTRGQLVQMLAMMQLSWQSRPGAAVASSLPAYPFDTSRLVAIEALGFSREHVLKVMTRMHAAGQNTRSVELVADCCLREPAEEDEERARSPSTVDRQANERAELQKKVQQLMESQEELRTCKICFDEPINCALQECGHLSVCTSCAESLANCPICQQPIRAFLKVYWS